MANTLGSTNGTLIGRQILTTLLEEFPLLKLISADFSDESALFGQEVKIKLPGTLTAGTYHTENGYTATDVSQADFPITINQHPHVTYGFNDQERTSHDFHLVDRFARNGAHALGKHFMDSLMALITAANFAHDEEQTVANFDRTIINKLRKVQNARKLPQMARYMVLNSDLHENVANDTQLIANPGSPADTVRSGRLGVVHGFETLEYAHLPSNAENLVGFCGLPEGLLIAARLPVLPDTKALGGGSVENVTEPSTRLSLQVRSWYDWQKGKEFRTYTMMYGVAAGNPECLDRIVTPVV